MNKTVRCLRWVACVLFVFTLIQCQQVNKKLPRIEETPSAPPSWAKHAIWYQIMVERFRNGDRSNDPVRSSLMGAWPDSIPNTWATTPWNQDWYQPDAWFADCEEDRFYHGLQARRYGGDLQGVLDKLDYLADLGINAVYFNPLNDAPSLHKYDPAYYRHIDRHFGPNPSDHEKVVADEVDDDPSTWKWTSADSLFLNILDRAHELGIRVIMDYSWNHTGRNFWAFEDVMKNGSESKFANWYYVKSFDDPGTAENEFDYKAWFGAMTLPELREDLEPHEHKEGWIQKIEGNIHSESLKQHIFNVTERWMDPNGDGDPSDGVDGFRLDVAAEVPMGFWREYRTFVKSINPEAYLVGEVWWENWPDYLLDPEPFLGDAFDAVMNYRWYQEARRLFAQAGKKISPSTFVRRMDSINANVRADYQYAMMNMASSHDSPRLLTSFHNKNRYKHNASPQSNKDYYVERPDADTRMRARLFLMHQFTYIGAPQIWNGEEMGMWGADDPDCRKPLWWDDISFEPEKNHPFHEEYAREYLIEADTGILRLYRRLCQLRNGHEVLRTGQLKHLLADDENGILCYSRYDDGGEIVVAFNLTDDAREITIPVYGDRTYKQYGTDSTIAAKNGTIYTTLAGMEGVVYIKE